MSIKVYCPKKSNLGVESTKSNTADEYSWWVNVCTIPVGIHCLNFIKYPTVPGPLYSLFCESIIFHFDNSDTL